MSRELGYLLLIFALMVIPRALQRFKLPAPITCLLFGIGAMLVLGEHAHDPVVTLLSTLGISSLFLFAGLEVDAQALRRGFWPLLVHLLLRAINLAACTWLGWRFLDLGWQAAGLLALALLTPSTGFILDTLDRLGLNPEERFWVTSKAIAAELMALAVLFFVLLADDPVQLGLSSLAMIGLGLALPLAYLAFARWVIPHSPGSEFSLMVMMGFAAAFVTYKLGVYYLVGAFLAGLVARLLQSRLPRLTSHDTLNGLKLFATFFVPFYFFHAGTEISRDALSFDALGLGLFMTALVVPYRVGMVWLQRRVLFRSEQRPSTLRVSLALSPTLVFTLVLASILHARFAIPDALFGGLILYTILNTLVPSLLLRTPFDVDPVMESAPMVANAVSESAHSPAG